MSARSLTARRSRGFTLALRPGWWILPSVALGVLGWVAIFKVVL